ncbi:sugar transporter SWEET1 [Diorhabda sublineata]|uniref:sugar transporter SWEET1 n=1 Tax=Diorhabda sublineata TaxID=1163346 RepID=UPI0024E151C0|nr:sugar transporter SWEET1 [Diorhabda sublineata]
MNESDFKNILATTASICTILQFLTGTLTCQKVVQNKSTGDISAFPFVSGCLSTSLWLRYGFLINDSSIILVNTVGATLFFAYVITFYLYSINKTVILRQFLCCLFLLIIILLHIHNNVDNTELVRVHLGLMCCGVTVLFFAAPLASLLHVIKVKNTESLPYHLIFATFIVSLQWLIYGLVLKDQFVQIPNFIGCILSGFQLSLFLIYPKKGKAYSNV